MSGADGLADYLSAYGRAVQAAEKAFGRADRTFRAVRLQQARQRDRLVRQLQTGRRRDALPRHLLNDAGEVESTQRAFEYYFPECGGYSVFERAPAEFQCYFSREQQAPRAFPGVYASGRAMRPELLEQSREFHASGAGAGE